MVGQLAPGGVACKRSLLAGVQDDVDALTSALGPRLAQRSGGQQPAVSCAFVIEHRNFDVALQGIVLKSVVTHDSGGRRVGR